MAQKHIVVLGAGFAGVLTTKKLAKHFKHNADVDITLIDKHSYFTYLTEIHEVATERVEPDAIRYDLQKLFGRQHNVSLVTDTITDVDKENKVVTTEHGSYHFDSLVISLGGEPNDFGTPGVKENGFTLWSMEDALRLRAHFDEIVREGAAELDPAKRAAMLTIVVCGSGFTGAETVGELIDYRKVLAKRYKLDPKEIKVLLVEAAPTIINMLDRTNADHAQAYLEKNDIQIITGAMITAVNPDSIDIKDQDSIPTRTLVWTAGVKTNSLADSFGIEAGRGGRLLVNNKLQAKGFEDKGIYVAGDNGYTIEDGAERPVPQTAQEAENEAALVAHNIAADINGSDHFEEFKDKNLGFTVSFGAYYGVAQVFGGKRVRGPIATIMKHSSNMLYFWKIGSAYYFFLYFLDEFFRTANGRTVFGSNTSRQGNVLWSLPLRLFMGLGLFINGIQVMNDHTPWLLQGHEGIAWLEILLGALIFLGLGTWCAAFITGILFFVCFLHWNVAWLLFGAIALLNGSGRSFGLDYWFVPWLQRSLSHAWYGQPQSVYKKK